MRIRKYFAAAAAAAGILGIATPVAGASAATTPTESGLPATSGPPSIQLPTINFVPPRVGPLSVDIGRTIINGEVIDEGLHVLVPGVSTPPITWPPGG